LELLDRLNGRMPALDAAGEERAVVVRHSQGDQWDLLVLYPVGTMASYFNHAAARQGAADFERSLDSVVSWREEEFVSGPALAELRAHDRGAGFYHIEMFIALAGRRDELLRERRMESDFSAATGRPDDLLFVRLAGAAWDRSEEHTSELQSLAYL